MTTQAPETAARTGVATRSRPASAIESWLPTRAGRIGALLLLILVVCAVAAPWIAPYPVDATDPGRVLGTPSLRHPLGSDDLGRDVLSRILHAYRVSLLIAAGSIGVALPVGIVVGTLAGYFGRLVDTLLMRPIEMLLAVPALLLGLTLVSIFGPGVPVTVTAIAIIYVPVFARIVRASSQVVRGELFVQASLSRGASHRHIIVKHVVPNAIGPVLVQATVLAGIAIQIEAALSFLGLGVQPPMPSLGSMLADGQNFLTLAPWIGIFPGIALALTVLAFNLVGDALRRRLDPGGLSR